MYKIMEEETLALKNFHLELLDEELEGANLAGELLAENLLQKYYPVRQALEKTLLNCIDGHMIGNVMEVLLNLMGLVLRLDKKYRRNIENFDAVYAFTDKAGDFYIAAIFRNNTLSVSRKKVENPTFTLIFKDNEALVKLLFSGAPDILNAMLNQEVDFEGNINYMSKFGYMAMHLVLELTGGMVFA